MRNLAELLERDGGRILAAYGLLLTGIACAAFRVPKAEDILVAGLTLIGRELMGTRASRD